MNECIFVPLIVFISLRPPDIHYRHNIARLGKVLREAIILGVLPNRHRPSASPEPIIVKTIVEANKKRF
jgi:hypothetical protein